MEIYLEKRVIQQLRISTQDAIEEGDSDTLREDLHDAFSEDQVEEIERRIDGGDFHDFINEVLDEWSGDDVDELFELIEAQLADVGIDLKQTAGEFDEDEPEEDEDDVSGADEELDLEPDEVSEGDEEAL